MEGSSVQVALFPMPKTVVFPPTAFSLNVFEPRYKSLVNTCLREDLPLGVGLAGDLISRSKRRPGRPRPVSAHAQRRTQTKGRRPMRNLNFYHPPKVFSFGKIIEKKNLPFGRYHIEVQLEHKARLLQIEQTLPFYVVKACVIDDHIASQERAFGLGNRLLDRAGVFLGDDKDLVLSTFLKKYRQKLKDGTKNTKKSFDQAFLPELMANILGLLQFDPAIKQKILEVPTYEDKADLVLALIEQALIKQRKEKKSDNNHEPVRKHSLTDATVLPFPNDYRADSL